MLSMNISAASAPTSSASAKGGVVAAVLAAGLLLLLPTPEALPVAGQRMAAIFVVVLILWVSEALPVGVTSLLAILLLPVFGVADLPTAFRTFISPVFFFVLAMFVIAQAFISSGLDRRFSLWLLARAGTDSRQVVRVFMVGTTSAPSSIAWVTGLVHGRSTDQRRSTRPLTCRLGVNSIVT